MRSICKKAEILATQAREKVTYYEVSERVRERYVEQGRSFKEVVGEVQKEQLQQREQPRQPRE